MKARKKTGLTVKRVERLRRRRKPGRYLDVVGKSTGGDPSKEPVRGLYLIVANKTNAHWELRYQLNGRTRWMGLGSASDFSLAEARTRARLERQKLTDKIDPLEVRRAEHAAAKAKRLLPRLMAQRQMTIYTMRTL